MKSQKEPMPLAKFLAVIFAPIIIFFFVSALLVPIFLPPNTKTDTSEVQIVTPEMKIQAEKARQEVLKKEQTPPTVYKDYPEMTSVPLNFKGYDIEDLYRYVSSIIKRKEKYQTTEEYEQQKKERIENSSLLKSYILVTASGILIDYNADAKKLTFDYPKYVSDSKTFELGGYVGSNAFGVSKAVRKYSRDVYRIDFSNKSQNKKGFINMEPEAAAKHDGELDYIYIVQIVPPYIVVPDSPYGDRECEEATIHNPEEGCTEWHTAKGKLAGIIIYNSKTGEIIHQEKL